jgi:hypothetical protein
MLDPEVALKLGLMHKNFLIDLKENMINKSLHQINKILEQIQKSSLIILEEESQLIWERMIIFSLTVNSLFFLIKNNKNRYFLKKKLKFNFNFNSFLNKL